MPRRDIPSPRAVLTLHDGRSWINEVRTLGPVPGTFATRDAAVAVGRELAMEARATHVIHDESGVVIEAVSYRTAGGLPGRSGLPSAWRSSIQALASQR
jgi:Uncharacterized protein conserved in bacteria (DUF2188)